MPIISIDCYREQMGPGSLEKLNKINQERFSGYNP